VTRPLRVALGAIAGVRGGPATYAVELVRALDELAGAAPAGSLALFVLTDRPDLFAGLAHAEPIEVPLPSPYRQPWWDNVAVPRLLRRIAPDVYHGTKNALPLVGMQARLASVLTIHYLAVYAEPETFALAQRLQLRMHLRRGARRAERVICVSEHAAGEVRARFGLADERVRVVRHGANPRFVPLGDEASRTRIRRLLGVEQGFLVAYVGTLQPRKRIEVAVEAVGTLRAQGLPVTLEIAGRRRPGFRPAWLESPPPWVRVRGELSDEQVVELYGAADAMVSPSTFEGFGLTFLEAMACGCPVVGLRATSVPEVVDDAGLLVERAEPDLIAGALGALLRDPALRAEKARRALGRARTFSWSRAARETCAVYREAVAASRARLAGDSPADRLRAR
jgi:glycosyltransferase involved in cell wall biosynthesis